MIIEINRHHIGGPYCDSTLYIDDQYICDCAENAYHRIPPGLYDVVLRYRVETHRKVPLLIPSGSNMQVTCGNFPIIKSGNGVHTNRRGQIIVGTSLVPGVVIHSYDTFLQLYDRINTCLRRGHQVQVLIKEPTSKTSSPLKLLTILLCLMATCSYAATPAAPIAQPSTYDTIALSLFGFVLVGFIILLACMVYASFRE